MDRLGGRGGEQPPHFRGRPVSSKEAATANEYFEPFLNATTLKSILGYHRSMCEYLHLKPNVFTHFYPKLRANLNTWRAKALWKKFDTRAAHKCYGKGKICAGTKVLIIGGGPCGLRTAIEAQLLGAKVVVIEKRDRLSRNNVLHLWPFVIEDLRMLGAKKFFGKFCAGSIDHISIRQLQCVLLKAALLLGVEIHTEVSFEGLIEPSATEKTGWRADIQPADHPVSQYEFDVIIGADGKRNTLQGFKRKEFRGKLAIAITANFINKKSEAEAQVEEISGVAFIFNQKFFKDLHAETRIDLENIVYYKDDTHYFVMTAKKASLLEKGVIKQDLADTEKLLAPDNVDRDALKNYAREAADFSTDYKLPDLEFAVNHYGQPDVAMFDFTSMYAAEYASQVVEKSGHRLLKILVGDSLLEPFWPTGSGCARGFLSSLDAAWAIRSWSMGAMTPLDVLAERESIYRLLAQTTPDNLNKDWKSYTLDPATRYPNLNKKIVQPIQTAHQYDTDNQENIEKMKRASSSFETRNEVPKKRRRGNVDSDVLLTWLAEQLRDHEDIHVTDLVSLFKDGKVLCAIIHHYRPDLLDYQSAISDNDPPKANQLAIDIFEKDLGISPIMTGEEITNTEDYLAMASYLTQVYDTFRGEIPHIKHPKLEFHKKLTGYSKVPKRPIASSQELFKNRTCGDVISLMARKSNKLKPNHLPAQKHQKCLTEKTFLNASINSLVKNPIKCTKSNFIDLTYVEHGILKTFAESDESQNSLMLNRGETKTDKSSISSKRKIKTKRMELSVIPEHSKKSKLLCHTGSQISKFNSNIFREIEVQCDKVSNAPPPVPEFESKIFNCQTFIQNVHFSPKNSKVANLQKYSAPKVEIPPKPEKRYYPKYYKILKSISRIKANSSPFVKRLIKNPYTVSSRQINAYESKKSEIRFKTSNDNNTTFKSSEGSIRIRLIERGSDDVVTYNKVEFKSSLNVLKITSKLKMSTDNLSRRVSFDSRVEVVQEMTGNPKKNKIYIGRVRPSLNPIQEILIKSTETINNKNNESLIHKENQTKTSIFANKKIEELFRNKVIGKSKIIMNDESLIHKENQTKTRIFANKKIEELFRNKVMGKSKREEDDNIIKSADNYFYNTTYNMIREKPLSAIAPVDRKIIRELKHVKQATGHLSKSCRKFRASFQNTVNDQIKKQVKRKLPLRKMSSYLEPEEFDLKTFKRVHQWISQTDFGSAEKLTENEKNESKMVQNVQDSLTDITSITQQINKMKKKGEYDDIKVEERTYCIRCEGPSSEDNFIENVKNVPEYKTPLKKLSKFSSNNMKSDTGSPTVFSAIIESEENELPEIKRSDLSLKALRTAHIPTVQPVATSRPSSRHKRHADAMTQKVHTIERKRERKRRTLEKVGPSVMERQKVLEEIEANRSDRMSKRKQQRQRQTEQFLKSMQMLQANAKPDHSQPFEDYSIFLYRQTAPKFKDRVKDLEKQFTYIPDYENRHAGLKPLANTNAEEDIASKIKSLEDRWTTQQPVDKKPKDLMRAIGKIETSDWNIKEIEKKILENKIGKPSSQNKDKERVPRWSKEEFRARQTKMEKKHLDPQDSIEEKYAEIDKNIKHLEMKLKEGTSRDLGQNKVASITEKLVSKVPQKEVKEHVEKAVPKTSLNLPAQSASENCHFCGKRVYLMEKLSAEGRFFHNGCFKCQYCHTQLRLGSYSFDRDGHYGYKFFCVHHYGMQGELPQPVKLARKQSQRAQDGGRRTVDNKNLSGVKGVDLLDRVQTPERIEFANLSTGNLSSDHEDPLSQMDEDEWTDKNFGASCAELEDSDGESSSSLSDTDSDDEDAYDDAMEEPVTKEGTMKWAERWKNSYRKKRGSDSDDYSSSDHSSYYENSSDDSDSETATEGEEEIRARELRQQEVRVQPPILPSDTGTDTEIVSDESSSESSSEIQNSATEISTDSEFAQDDPTPTREIPSILLNDFNVTKTRGTGSRNYPRKIQVTTGFIGKTAKGQKKPDIELKLTPLVPTTLALKKPIPAPLPRIEGYALNRTQSTGGIAAKVSLELKKRYLLGESGAGAIQKSGSASTLDTKFKSFQNTISDCQKLLKPAPEISASMQVFCSKLDERHSPILSPKASSPFFKDEKREEKDENPLPPPDITITAIEESKNNKNQSHDENRPRSPVPEACIAVPDINWQLQDENQSSDSLSVNSSSENEPLQSRNFQFENIPRVEVHIANDNEKDDVLLDSLCPDINNKVKEDVSLDNKDNLNKHPSQSLESDSKSQENKSVCSEKKSLNQPKSLPNLENTFPEIHKALHVKLKEKDSPDDNKSSKTMSGKSTPEGTAALTETELSDWARDGNVSDDIEFDFSQGSENILDKHKAQEKAKDIKNKIAPISNTLEANLDSIEFMDTGTETSSDDGIVDSQNGYVLFKDEEDLIEDSLNPNINEILEARNIYITRKEDGQKTPTIQVNATFCMADDKTNQFGSEVIDLKPADLEKLKQKQSLTDHEEDSLLIVETGTTTEENTCSDSTVKNITEITKDSVKDKTFFKVESFQKQRLEDKLAKVKAEAKEQMIKDATKKENLEFQEHCERLQLKVDFGNAKDSIDIRKSRRKSKTDILHQPDLIQEEKEKSSPTKDNTLNLRPAVGVSDALYKKENLKKERDVNQKLIQEMVMNKMKAENKSLERKKRNRTGATNLSPSRPYQLTKSSTTDSVTKINFNNLERNLDNSVTPDLLSSSNPLQNSQSSNINNTFEKFATSLSPKSNRPRPLSVFSTLTDFKKPAETSLLNSENCSMPDIRKNLFATDETTPKAPPRFNRPSDIIKTAERLKETARARARLLSNEDLGLSPEDRINRLKDKFSRKTKDTENVDPLVQESIESLVLNTEKRNSLMYSNDTLTKKKNNSFKRSKSGENDVEVRISVHKNDHDTTPIRTKSIPEIPKRFSGSNQIKSDKKICKSDSNLLEVNNVKPKKEKKSKDRERRKSITKLLSNIFTKKSPTGSKENKGLFSRLSPKSKPISKSCTDLDNIEPEAVIDESDKRKSLSEVNIPRRDLTPPPVPPLPVNYTVKGTDDSSDGEQDWRRQDRSSCDTLNQSGALDSSLAGRKSGKSRRVSRQSQLKRHRMAQEIQRKLEETEVKTRELEHRGVQVEKQLRGEGNAESSSNNDSSRSTVEVCRDEAELLQEWFDLMRDRTELRRYEKELMVRAQELELEDRHARLQAELRERLESKESKTKDDVRTEESIISEMMDIVAQRDSLIAVLEEDRLRYSNEDKDLEEQMLSEGLRLTPIRKTPEK